MPRLVYIVTASISARNLLRGQLAYMRQAGYDVHVIAGDKASLPEVEANEGVNVHWVPMERGMAPLVDLKSYRALKRLLKTLAPDIVNASTPKAGLLGMMAAKSLRVKGRIYVLRGLRLETLTGWQLAVQRWTEKRAAKCAHRVVCVSPSLRDEAVARGLFPASKGLVIGIGSSNGVRVDRFLATDDLLARAPDLRRKSNLPDDAIVIGFVGRFTKDKGMTELMRAFAQAREQEPRLALYLVGDFEKGDPVDDETRRLIEGGDGVYRAGFLSETAAAYHLMDALCLPTYREGFPNVPIEAAAAGVPTIGSDATGVVDAVVHGVTGWIVPRYDAEALARAFVDLAQDPARAKAMGEAAKARALQEFPPERIWSGLADLYNSLDLR